jgi:DNA-binding transcriptional LysR family regulator
MAELDAAHAELEAVKGVETGRVSVGTMHTMGPIDLSLVLAIFHQRHPGVELTVREESSEELAQMIRDDELDVAFLSVTERVESHGLALHRLLQEELVVLLPPGHGLADRAGVRMADLREEEFISYRPGARLRELLFTAGDHAGFEPRVKLELNESQRIRRLVSRGMGVALLPRSDAVSVGAEVAHVALKDPPLSRDITLAWRQERRHPPAVKEFLDLARSTFADGGAAGA